MKVGQAVLPHPPLAPLGVNRRTFLKAFGIGGTVLALAPRLLSAASNKPLYPKLTNLEVPNEIVQVGNITPTILVWCDGGLSQFESFDPNLKAPSDYKGYFGTISTSVPGLVISENFPKMARVMDEVLLHRGVYSTGIPEHFEQTIHTITCSHEIGPNDVPAHPSMLGRFATEALRPNHEVDIPVINSSKGSKPYDVMHPQGTISIKFSEDPKGYISPFGEPVSEEELEKRLILSKQLGIDLRSLRSDKYEEDFTSAKNVLTKKKGIGEAFDLSKIDSNIRKEFGETPVGNALLTALLLARAGVKFIVVHHGYFDDHYNYIDETKDRMPPFDLALSTLVRRAEEEGKVFALGTEFGRTPKLNRGKPPYPPGRDHWIKGYSVLFAGKGVNKGVVGTTDKDGFASSHECHSSGFLPTVVRLGGHELRWKESKKPLPTWPIF